MSFDFDSMCADQFDDAAHSAMDFEGGSRIYFADDTYLAVWVSPDSGGAILQHCWSDSRVIVESMRPLCDLDDGVMLAEFASDCARGMH